MEVVFGKTNSKFIYRILVYILGMFSLSFGVAFSINSRLGVSPVNSLPYIISLILEVKIGVAVIVVFSSYILVQFLMLRAEFKWINMTQLIFSTIFGYFVNFAKFILGDFSIPTYAGQLVMLAISIFLVAIGICLYMDARLVNMPMEGMTHAITEKIFRGLPFHDVKVIMDTIVVTTGVILSVVFLGNVSGVREGTILCALTVGRMMKPLQKIILPVIEKICF